jgi:hypothetical protein
MENKPLPKFVKLCNSALRLEVNKKRYYRDAGDWSVEYRFNKHDHLVSKSIMPHLNNEPLIEITREEWKEDNKGYLPKNVR